MNARLFFLLFNYAFSISYNGFSQTPGEWTWMHGPQITQQPVFGTKGVSSPSNIPPAIYGALPFTDLQGNLWSFGGGYYSDLWKYNIATNEWTWMNGAGTTGGSPVYGTLGIADTANKPAAHGFGAFSWTDMNGNFWLFGGYTLGGNSNALWRYEPSTNQWTWMSGTTIPNDPGIYGIPGIPSVNIYPPARNESSSSWIDLAGNLWLFGGTLDGFSENKNDLWKYDIATNEWTWMKGDTGVNVPAVYGLKGVSDPANDPGSRCSHSHWSDLDGNLWLFGGGKYIQGEFKNDMWKYDPAINEWTWMSGNAAINDSAGHFSSACASTPAGLPGSRFENKMCWTDSCGGFWMYGGNHGLNPSSGAPLNDLWRYDPCNNIWTFIKGDSIPNQQPVDGNQGQSHASNSPGGRMGSASWKDTNGYFWLAFGIVPWSSNSNVSHTLWRYVPDYSCGTCDPVPYALFTSTENQVCPGACITFVNNSTEAGSFNWQFNGGIPQTSNEVNPEVCYLNPGQYDVTLIASTCMGDTDTLTIVNYITVHPQPQVQQITQSGDTLFAVPGAASYQWFYDTVPIPGATDLYYVAVQNGNYNVVATDSNGCEVEASIFNVIAEIQTTVGSWQLAIFPNPVESDLRCNIEDVIFGTAPQVEISIYNMLGKIVIAASLPTPNSQLPTQINVSNLLPGIYFLEINSHEKILRTKFVKQ
jgi:hypothetical protein